MNDVELPETRYATSGEVSVAYQVMGEGSIDVVMVPGIISHVEALHELPGYTAFLRRLASFARVITFDKRGQGLSDRMTGAPSLEERMDDIRAVMDAAGSARAVLAGFSEGAAMSIMFATTYPDRVTRLVLFGGFVAPRNFLRDTIDTRIRKWGDGTFVKDVVTAGQPASDEALRRFGRVERLCASPGALRALLLLNAEVDVRSILPSVRVPCLVQHRRTDDRVPIEAGRAMAAAIPGARLIEYPTGDHAFWTGDTEALLGDIEEFVTGERNAGADELERVLATVLFTDIVDSTSSAVALGDKSWRSLLDRHDSLARQMIDRHRGRLVKSTGDGILATFDGPGRAVRCALALSGAAGEIGVRLRAGLHTGEIEMRGSDVGGVAVHAAARVMSESGPGEVLVSRVVTDLVAGAGLKFADRGPHDLKGLPGRWDLFAASL
ncbi:MAG TPA: adenylate/guanylate cyclase domain-containing protein [Reyranella sp.]